MSSPAPRTRRRVRLGFAVCLALLSLLPHGLVAPGAPADEEDSPAQSAALHRWGAVTLFHGLPSDRVRAVAQDPDGAMWFGTDAGLARYDGRRTQTVTDEGLASRRVTALRFDDAGALWVGTDAGAFVRTAGGRFRLIAETKDARVAAIDAPSRGRAVVATAEGLLLDCRLQTDDTVSVRTLAERQTFAPPAPPAPPPATTGASAQSSSTKPAFELTGLAASGERVYVGTRGRGLMAVERGAAREVAGRTRPFYVETVGRDAAGRIFFGARAAAAEGGLFAVEDRADGASRAAADGRDTSEARDEAGVANLPRVVRAGDATGAVTAIGFDARGDLYAGTDGQGVFRLRGSERVERFTFASTAGGLRSDRVYAVFVDREGVTWFGTDRGVCRYDPRGLRVETISNEPEANFVRALLRTSRGRLLAGTSRGLYVRARDASAWRLEEALERKSVYSIVEDARGRVLVATAAGLFAGRQTARGAQDGAIQFAPDARPRERVVEATAGDASAPPQVQPKPAESDEGLAQPPPAAQEKTPEGATPAADKSPTAEGAAAAGEEKGEEKEERRPVAAAVVPGQVRAVVQFNGATYVAVYGRGVERLDEDFRRTPVWPAEGDDARLREVISLHADDAAGRLWIGTAASGVFYFDGAKVETEAALEPLATSAVRAVGAGRDGLLWLATSRGLYARRDGGELLNVAPGVDARAVVANVNAPDAAQNASQEPSREPSSQPPPQAWCATAGAGVLKVSWDERFGFVTARLDAEQGLPSQTASAVLPVREDDGDALTLLVGTSRGLARYEPGGTRPVLVPVRLTASRPLPLEDLQGPRDDDSASSLMGEDEGILSLDYPQTGLVLDVAATSSRTFPEQFQYGFLLYDESGRVLKRKLSHDSQFGVENLKPGRYRVAAHAFSADLVASEPFTFDFRIESAPFPWTTAALSVLLALALVALMWGYFQHRRIVRAGAELLDANRQLAAAKLQLANEAESERRRIARDLHDQTLADLRRLLLLTDEIPTGERRAATGDALGATGGTGAGGGNGGGLTRQKTVDPSVLRAEIESISQEIRRICEDLSPSVLENVGFASALEWAIAERVSHMRPDCKFTYEFSCPEHLEERLHFAPGVQMQVYRIVQEAVSNVCRHASATHVRLAVEEDGAGGMTLTLEDDGRGLPQDIRKGRHDGGRGLANIRARASLIEAEVEWRRREGGGTVFVLRKRAGAQAEQSGGR
ncbi:MAG TPA: two-component regulator propeller domain-containing protein [Pyrinomonadaceae bacterium]|nr:two-component regulator propeller domain-containing protein [Pyrinomonadaceae bacterium]